MNSPPKVIYLQWYDENDGKALDPFEGEVTWCIDRINENDLEYILHEKQRSSSISPLPPFLVALLDDDSTLSPFMGEPEGGKASQEPHNIP